MAYISGRCVACREKTKQRDGEYSGRDEKGKRFWGRMYLCEKADCDINRARLRAEKELRGNRSVLPGGNGTKTYSKIPGRQENYRTKG